MVSVAKPEFVVMLALSRTSVQVANVVPSAVVCSLSAVRNQYALPAYCTLRKFSLGMFASPFSVQDVPAEETKMPPLVLAPFASAQRTNWLSSVTQTISLGLTVPPAPNWI